MIARTQAKIGRSMKIRDMSLSRRRLRLAPAFIAPGGGAWTFCGALAGTGLICAPSFRLAVPLGDHLLAGREALGHDPVRSLRPVGDDGPLDRPVAGPDHEQGGIALRIAGDRLLRARGMADVSIGLGELRGHEHARKKDRLRIGEARRAA